MCCRGYSLRLALFLRLSPFLLPLLSRQRLLFSFLLIFFDYVRLTGGRFTLLQLLALSSAIPIWTEDASGLMSLPFFRAWPWKGNLNH